MVSWCHTKPFKVSCQVQQLSLWLSIRYHNTKFTADYTIFLWQRVSHNTDVWAFQKCSRNAHSSSPLFQRVDACLQGPSRGLIQWCTIKKCHVDNKKRKLRLESWAICPGFIYWVRCLHTRPRSWRNKIKATEIRYTGNLAYQGCR